jgi:hypothetical protein
MVLYVMSIVSGLVLTSRRTGGAVATYGAAGGSAQRSIPFPSTMRQCLCAP